MPEPASDAERPGPDGPAERVTGIGGVFLRARDPAALVAWYRARLGVPIQPDGVGIFRWRELRPDRAAETVFAAFPDDTTYFGPGERSFMVNFRVVDLDRMLRQLREAGCTVLGEIEESEFGRFGWVVDPEGNRVELWEPPPVR